jgi:ergothioneine biosynthesis protein EgtB
MQPRAPVLCPDALQARCGDAPALAQALIDARRDTLHTFAAFEGALPSLRVPQTDELNPPLWELGHIGWFQTYWLARYSERSRGWRADPHAPRTAPAPLHADALYDSARVAHADRWSLPLPDAQTTRHALDGQLTATLELLATQTGTSDSDLYFFRLALLHEDMHHEAALYMAQALGIPLDGARWHARALPEPGPALHLPATHRVLGADPNAGFAFDNEYGQLPVPIAATDIDNQVVRWREYLPFVESGGYAQAQWWGAQGWQWRQSSATGLAVATAPRYLRRDGATWWHARYGHWQRLDLHEPACHLSFFEAQAWCRWAGRQLPSEAQWEWASAADPERFRWGDVWEWTASAFAPFPGFCAHPYREYSAPWFDGRPVLRGASFMTQDRMRHPSYRNFFLPGRNDISAGFRSCQAAAA